MLFMNNPEAFKAITEGRRQDNGQHISTIVDVTRTTATTRPSSKTQSPHRRLSPLVAAN
jgi:hypothetical protein